ncbi:hypothetical protein KU70_04370 [Campylobacter fetus]|nr:hypothetical protein KU70_04370 [Campylobacter fetus]
MQIGDFNSNSMFGFLNIKPDSPENIEKIKESASKIDAKNITQNYFLQFQNNTFSNTSGNINVQVGLMSFSFQSHLCRAIAIILAGLAAV